MSDVSNPTKVSREGVILIKSFEGFRSRAFRRADGRWVVGYGHTASARDGAAVSEAEAELLLQYDLIPVVKAVAAINTRMSQHQFDALASFAFSVGVERFMASEVVARLNAGAPAQAADALIAWPDEQRNQGPPRRRAAEYALFLAPAGAPVTLADLLLTPFGPTASQADPFSGAAPFPLSQPFAITSRPDAAVEAAAKRSTPFIVAAPANESSGPGSSPAAAAEPEDDALPPPTADAPKSRRPGRGEVGAFIGMLSIGLASLGAAMAAFRRAAELGGVDALIVGGVLAVIAAACVAVSGVNLYQLWGRSTPA